MNEQTNCPNNRAEFVEMLPSEKIELGIYRWVKGHSGGRAVTLPELASSIGPDIESSVVVQRLVDLYERKLVALSKYVGDVHVSYADYPAFNKSRRITFQAILNPQQAPSPDWQTNFFYIGDFVVGIAPQGARYFEELDKRDRTENQEQLIFISCGQYSEEERRLGQDLVAAVDELLPPFKGYFAQNENSLDALSHNIFGALHKCAGFIAILHRRGVVNTPNGNHTRASVWIEQEIAIAAFLAQILKKQFPVAVYIQRGITREGVRQLLQINLADFETESEVLEHFRKHAKSGKFKPAIEKS